MIGAAQLTLAAGGSIAALGLARQLYARAVERRVDEASQLDATGVQAGARAIALNAGPAVLLLHGFGDTPQSVAVLAHDLHRRGWSVRAPRLPGHGTRLNQFARARAPDWFAAASAAYTELRDTVGPVCVVGQSMGAALALRLAADHHDVPTVVLLAPYLRLPFLTSVASHLGALVTLALPYIDTRTSLSIRDPLARAMSLGYGVTTPRLVGELRRTAAVGWDAAPAVKAPTLMLQSSRDPRIARPDAERIFARLGGDPKELAWFHDSGHVLAVDRERDVVFSLVADWLAKYGPQHGGEASKAVGQALA